MIAACGQPSAVVFVDGVIPPRHPMAAMVAGAMLRELVAVDADRRLLGDAPASRSPSTTNRYLSPMAGTRRGAPTFA